MISKEDFIELCDKITKFENGITALYDHGINIVDSDLYDIHSWMETKLFKYIIKDNWVDFVFDYLYRVDNKSPFDVTIDDNEYQITNFEELYNIILEYDGFCTNS